MSWVNWTAIVGFGLILLAVAIFLLVSVSVSFAHQWFLQQQSQHVKKARILRTQFLFQLRFIEEHLAPRNQPSKNFDHELYEPLQAMWMQADLLTPEEMEAVHRACRILLLLRNKPSLNKKEVNVATDAIRQACRICEDSPGPSLARQPG